MPKTSPIDHHMKKDLEKYRVVEHYRVHWGDMDAANHVNNLVYLRWAESARIRYFEAVGIDISFSAEEVGPILGWQECKYIFPITFPDTAITGIRTAEIKADRLILECAVFSEKHQRIAAISRQSIIPYSYSELKKAPLPEKWLERVKEVDNL